MGRAACRISERETTRRELGWYGELALAPENGPDQPARQAALAPAQRTVFTLIGALLGALLWLARRAWPDAAAGLLVAGDHSWRHYGGQRPRRSLGGNICPLSNRFRRIKRRRGFVDGTMAHMAWAGAAALLSLIVLRLAAHSRRVVAGNPPGDRLDGGRGLLREVGAGLATYVMALPILGGRRAYSRSFSW